MPSDEATQVASSFDDCIMQITSAIRYSKKIPDKTDLPEAFAGVAQHLHLVQTVLALMMRYLENIQPDQEKSTLRDSYQPLKVSVAQMTTLAERLRRFFIAATSSEKLEERMKTYAAEVGSGDRLEQVAIELLEELCKAVMNPPVTEENNKNLRKALEAVKKLPPSLDEATSSETYMNTGAGIQAIFKGKGNQNFNTGKGTQFTGNINTFNQGPQREN